MYQKLSHKEKSAFEHPTLANFQTFQAAYMLSSAFLICTFCPQYCPRLHDFASDTFGGGGGGHAPRPP